MIIDVKCSPSEQWTVRCDIWEFALINNKMWLNIQQRALTSFSMLLCNFQTNIQHSICGFVRTQLNSIFDFFASFLDFDLFYWWLKCKVLMNIITKSVMVSYLQIWKEQIWNRRALRNEKKWGENVIVISFFCCFQFSSIRSRNPHYLIFNEKQAGCFMFNFQCAMGASKILEDFIPFRVDYYRKEIEI